MCHLWRCVYGGPSLAERLKTLPPSPPPPPPLSLSLQEDSPFFPTLSGTTLSGHSVTLPDSLAGSVALLTVSMRAYGMVSVVSNQLILHSLSSCSDNFTAATGWHTFNPFSPLCQINNENKGPMKPLWLTLCGVCVYVWLTAAASCCLYGELGHHFRSSPLCAHAETL